MSVLIFAISVAIVILGFAYYCFRISFHVPKIRHENLYEAPKGKQYANVAQRMAEISMIMESSPCEWVQIDSHDGTKLYGRYYEYYPGAPMFLAFHGYRSMALRDCAGAFALAQKLGFNILAVDQRSHGRSDGNVITFGIRERYDCQDWVRYCCQRFGKSRPIVLCGISMGAATVLMASELSFPPNVAGIMADCPYASPAGIICKVAKDRGYPPKLAYPMIWLGARLFAGLNIKESSAAEAVRHTDLPILLIHGEDDRFVPCDMSREIYHNCSSNAQLFTFPDAGHGLCYIHDPKRYEKICVDFLWRLEALRPDLTKSEFAQKILGK